MQECRKRYLRPYCIKRLFPGFCTYDAFYTTFPLIFLKLQDFDFQRRCKMCVRTHIFHQELNFAENVTYDLLSFSRRYYMMYCIKSYQPINITGWAEGRGPLMRFTWKSLLTYRGKIGNVKGEMEKKRHIVKKKVFVLLLLFL